MPGSGFKKDLGIVGLANKNCKFWLTIDIWYIRLEFNFNWKLVIKSFVIAPGYICNLCDKRPTLSDKYIGVALTLSFSRMISLIVKCVKWNIFHSYSYNKK